MAHAPWWLLIQAWLLSSSKIAPDRPCIGKNFTMKNTQVTPAPSEMSRSTSKLLLVGPCRASASTPAPPNPHLSPIFSPAVQAQPTEGSECIRPTLQSAILGRLDPIHETLPDLNTGSLTFSFEIYYIYFTDYVFLLFNTCPQVHILSENILNILTQSS